jgi:hypothetical protein
MGVAAFTYNGTDQFTVEAGPDTLIDVTGPFDGTVVIPEGTTSLGLTAEGGAWTIEINAPSAAQRFASTATGNRSDVLSYTGPGGIVTLDPADLVLTVFDANGNASSVANGDQLPAGSLVQVNATGAWSISVG